MLNKKLVAVVIPAFNEEKQIRQVINTLPDFIDQIIVVNDHSTDDTEKVVHKYIDQNTSSDKIIKSNSSKRNILNKYNRAELILSEIEKRESTEFTPSNIINKSGIKGKVILINHLQNAGVGASIATGYQWCRENNIDCSVVMAGDGQMDPNELLSICEPVVNGEVDYVKGNRLTHRSAFFVVPKIRYFGNSVLSLLTKIASGYWHISDTQCGYTAISINALNAIRIHEIYKSYGCPNDILVKLNIAFCTVKEVGIKPIYSIGEVSKMKIWKVIPTISFLLFKSFFMRLYFKYLFRDFHPLFLLYNFGFLLAIISLPVGIIIINRLIDQQSISYQLLIIFMYLSITSLQSIFFAMWMDIQDNERLQK